jgi:hypothetical protein
MAVPEPFEMGFLILNAFNVKRNKKVHRYGCSWAAPTRSARCPVTTRKCFFDGSRPYICNDTDNDTDADSSSHAAP